MQRTLFIPPSTIVSVDGARLLSVDNLSLYGLTAGPRIMNRTAYYRFFVLCVVLKINWTAELAQPTNTLYLELRSCECAIGVTE